jgi:hypothetical protein
MGGSVQRAVARARTWVAPWSVIVCGDEAGLTTTRSTPWSLAQSDAPGDACPVAAAWREALAHAVRPMTVAMAIRASTARAAIPASSPSSGAVTLGRPTSDHGSSRR